MEPGTTDMFVIKVTLLDIRPPVWRRLRVPAAIALDELHQVIQVAMGWEDGHLHLFEVGGRQYGPRLPEPDWGMADERRAQLTALAGPGETLRYIYDMGDGWVHDIRIERREMQVSGAPRLECLAGRRACPPEDVGGPWGYAAFLKALGDPDDPEHQRLREWWGGNFDPEAFDREAVNKALAPRGRRRRPANNARGKGI
ncbi:MAG: plasmid pRiA4b ORF-3 family protein [Anaerolineae bacterium]|nr:MAG: plasmid pRiA4b ORF-3 family protein [Anaerolineae bacterium]